MRFTSADEAAGARRALGRNEAQGIRLREAAGVLGPLGRSEARAGLVREAGGLHEASEGNEAREAAGVLEPLGRSEARAGLVREAGGVHEAAQESDGGNNGDSEGDSDQLSFLAPGRSRLVADYEYQGACALVILLQGTSTPDDSKSPNPIAATKESFKSPKGNRAFELIVVWAWGGSVWDSDRDLLYWKMISKPAR